MKTVTIPFDLEMAKKIQSGEVEGKILDDYKTEYEIIKYDAKGNYPMIGVYFNEENNTSHARSFTHDVIHEAFEVARKHMNPEEAVNYIIKRHEQEKNNPPLPTC